MQELSPIKILHLDNNPVQLPCCYKTATWQWSGLETGAQKWVGKLWLERGDGSDRLGKA